MKTSVLSLLLVLAFGATAVARTIELPQTGAVYSVDVPEGWQIEKLDSGIRVDSDDNAATILFETAAPDELEELIDANIEWLKENKVDIDTDSKAETKFEAAGITWSAIKYDGKDEEYGPATIMMVFGATPEAEKVLMVTYWVTKEGEKTNGKALEALFDSVKPAE